MWQNLTYKIFLTCTELYIYDHVFSEVKFLFVDLRVENVEIYLSPFVTCSVFRVDFYFCKLKYTVFEEWFTFQKEVTQI